MPPPAGVQYALQTQLPPIWKHSRMEVQAALQQ